MEKAFLINQIKEEAARITFQDLKKWGVIGKDWILERLERNTTLSKKETLIVYGKIVKIKECKVDMMVFKDKHGREFAYPIGVKKENVLFNATEASSIIEEYPPYLKKGIRRVSFIDMENPYDPYWRVKYKNRKHVSLATDGGNITYWRKPSDFKGTTAHEAGHILDGETHKISSSKGWQEAVAKDDEIYKNKPIRNRVSKYAETNDAEDFAECMKAYITDHDSFKKWFPNRAAYIREKAQELSRQGFKSA